MANQLPIQKPERYIQLGLTPISIQRPSMAPSVRWGKVWSPTLQESEHLAARAFTRNTQRKPPSNNDGSES